MAILRGTDRNRGIFKDKTETNAKSCSTDSSAVFLDNMSNDWNTVTVLRGKQARGPGAAKSAGAINAARRRGDEVVTEHKYGGGTNKHHVSHVQNVGAHGHRRRAGC